MNSLKDFRTCPKSPRAHCIRDSYKGSLFKDVKDSSDVLGGIKFWFPNSRLLNRRLNKLHV